MKLPPLVEVTWYDAADAFNDWKPLKKVKNRPVETHTVGYLVKKNKQALTVVATINDQRHAAHGLTIPRGMVKKVRKLD